MAVTGMITGGLLVLAMIGVSVRGWLVLPSDARIPIHRGLSGYNNFVSKTAGLVTWAAAGVIVYGLYLAVFAEALRTHDGRSGAFLLILPIVILILIVAQIGAVRAALRMSGRAGSGTGLG